MRILQQHVVEQTLFCHVNRSSNVLEIDLGHLKITSDPEQERIMSTKVAHFFLFL